MCGAPAERTSGRGLGTSRLPARVYREACRACGAHSAVRKALVLVQEALAQVEDRRGPEADEDRGLAPPREVEREGEENREQRPSDVESLAAVHGLPTFLVYPVQYTPRP